jgi:hypothetical protein
MSITRHRFTVAEYHKMAEAGIFTEDDRVELVEGEIVERAPIGWRHMEAVNRLTHLLVERSSGRYVARTCVSHRVHRTSVITSAPLHVGQLSIIFLAISPSFFSRIYHD